MTTNFTIIGPVVHSDVSGQLIIIDNGFVVVENGRISQVGKYERTKFQNDVNATTIELLPGQFLMPGMIDTHIHAPQYPNSGLGYDKPLLEWLDTYTFPLEAKYSDTVYAEQVYNIVVQRTLGNGTTTAAYFATIHLESSEILADAAINAGQRALIGKVNMNQNYPEGYGETTEQSIIDTEIFVNAIINKNSPLVQPIITPRFAISCDMSLMTSLGDMAARYDVHIQTHISENTNEVETVLSLYPDCANYADVYDKAGLLTNKTILAHGIYLDSSELQVLSDRGTSVSHCPNSNTSLQSGLCDVRRLMSGGVNVGLGTDVAGGYSASMLDAMRCALTTSIHISFKEENYIPLNYQDVFYLATLGGARALAMDSEIGNFTVGKSFDALVVTLQDIESPVDILSSYTTAELLQKFIYVGDDRNISQVFVAGKLVKNKRETSAPSGQFDKILL